MRLLPLVFIWCATLSIKLTNKSGYLTLLPEHPSKLVAPVFSEHSSENLSLTLQCSEDAQKHLKFSTVNLCDKVLTGNSQEFNKYFAASKITFSPNSYSQSFDLSIKYIITDSRNKSVVFPVIFSPILSIDVNQVATGLNDFVGKRMKLLDISSPWNDIETFSVAIEKPESLKVSFEVQSGHLFITFDGENVIPEPLKIGVTLVDTASGLRSQTFSFNLAATTSTQKVIAISSFISLFFLLIAFVIVIIGQVPSKKTKKIETPEQKALNESIKNWNKQVTSQSGKVHDNSTQISVIVDFQDAQLNKGPTLDSLNPLEFSRLD